MAADAGDPFDVDFDTIIPPLTTPTTAQRLSIPTPFRVWGGAFAGVALGFVLGVSKGGRASALRFRAENAHRLPTSTKGWYLYHKSKNYRVMYSGLMEGLKMGGRIGVWTFAFLLLEASIDKGRRGRKDFLSTTCAGITMSGVWSVWHRLPLSTAARTTKLGAAAGLTFGLVQDALALMKGRRLYYVDCLLGEQDERAKGKT